MNKNINFKFFIILILYTITFINCKKDNTTNTPVTKTDVLSGGSSKTWVISKVTQQTAGSQPVDVTSQVASCEKDNLYTYKSNGVYIQDEGATKCTNSQPQTITGTFSFNADETELTVTNNLNPSSVGRVTVLELTTSNFNIRASELMSNGITRVNFIYYIPK
jgi:hypothetical protein